MKNILLLDRKYIFNSLWIAILLCGVLLAGYSCQCGLGVTFDSKAYIQIADDFINNGFLDGFNSYYLTAKPPLFPFVLMLFRWLDYKILYIVLYILILIASYKLITRIIQSGSLRLIAWVLISVSTPLLLIHNYLWSEPLFIVFLLF